MYQLKFAIITPALITGAFAERIRFNSYIIFLVLFSIFIFSPLAHATWHPDGVLAKLGVLGFCRWYGCAHVGRLGGTGIGLVPETP
jgi:Amt family ammonium transporter